MGYLQGSSQEICWYKIYKIKKEEKLWIHYENFAFNNNSLYRWESTLIYVRNRTEWWKSFYTEVVTEEWKGERKWKTLCQSELYKVSISCLFCIHWTVLTASREYTGVCLLSTFKGVKALQLFCVSCSQSIMKVGWYDSPLYRRSISYVCKGFKRLNSTHKFNVWCFRRSYTVKEYKSSIS